MADDQDITNKVLLQHMQAGHESLRVDIKKLQSDVGTLKTDVGTLKHSVAKLQENDKKTHAALQNLYKTRLETDIHVDDHEERIIDIEEKELPKIREAVGIS
jgi:predicted nuclease with TOPRIM domain